MAQRVFHAPNYTPTAQADGGALTNATYMAIKGGSGTQLINISEVVGSGLAGASGAMIMQLARASTIETTPTALAAPNSDGPKNPSTAALAAPPVTFVAAAAGPQRSATTSDAKLELNFNAFGGIFRWQVPRGEEWGQLGNTASLGESIYSQFTGGSSNAISSHIVYEPA
jgi:hypothetical protein